jgi:D-alanyl-D-alanine carboxypeptidase
MVTALVAVERAPLDRLVRPTRPYNVIPVVIGLEPGDSLTLEEALYGLMLNSGNDAALAIAETAADGSTERFVGWMNDLARRLGLQHSQFRNPHGLDQDGHLASAYDMAIIGRALMRQPVLAQIVGQQRHVVEGPPRWVFRSTNPLLGIYDGADGIKTGFDDNAGRCLIVTAQRDGRRAIAVVMNSPATGDEAASLLDYAFKDAAWGSLKAGSPTTMRVGSRVAMLRADLDGDGAPKSVVRAGQLMAATARPAAAR